MFLAKTSHVHKFNEIKEVKLVADNKRYSIEKHGAWSIVIRLCECGEERAIDMVPRKEAQQKLVQLRGSNGTT